MRLHDAPGRGDHRRELRASAHVPPSRSPTQGWDVAVVGRNRERTHAVALAVRWHAVPRRLRPARRGASSRGRRCSSSTRASTCSRTMRAASCTGADARRTGTSAPSSTITSRRSCSPTCCCPGSRRRARASSRLRASRTYGHSSTSTTSTSTTTPGSADGGPTAPPSSRRSCSPANSRRRSSVGAYAFHPGYVSTGFAQETTLLKLAQFVGRGHLGRTAGPGRGATRAPRHRRDRAGAERHLLRRAEARRTGASHGEGPVGCGQAVGADSETVVAFSPS